MIHIRRSVLAFLTLSILACGQKNGYKELRADVMKLHDEVMAKNDLVVHQQMKLDSLLKGLDSLKQAHPGLDTVKSRQDLQGLKKGLEDAEEEMNQWMQRFEPDAEGKSNDAAVAYFEGEKRKLNHIDSLYNVNTKATESYLKDLGTKK